MARTDTFNNWATDIADSIREKTGKTDKIPAANFDTEIAGIQTGGSEVTKGFIINEWSDDGYATDVTIVGMTSIPNYYFATYSSSSNANALVKNVQKIQLPNDLTSIGNNAFLYSANLTSMNLPSGITSIGVNAFQGCKKLALTSLPSGLTQIPNSAFRNCENISLTSLPSGITSIGELGFHYCQKLKITSLPSGLTSIGSEAFSYCDGLTTLEIPAGVTVINTSTFNYCYNLTTLTFLGDITAIKSSSYGGTFYDCEKLTKLVFQNITSVPTLGHIYAFYESAIANGTGYIYVPDTLVESFKVATNWSTYADQIKPISELEASS